VSRNRLLAARVGLVVALLGGVELAVRGRALHTLFVPAPSTVLVSLYHGVTGGTLLRPLLVTLYEAGLGSLIAVGLGVAGGYLLWRFGALGQAYEPLLGGVVAAPLILLYPISLVVFGRTTTAVVALGACLGLAPVALYARRGFLDVRPVFLKVGAVSRLSRPQNFRHVLLPAAAPMIFTGARLGITATLISVVALEYLAQIGGLGKTIAEGYLRFDLPGIYAAVTVVVVVTAALIVLAGRLERAARR
jgi:NitT/TauT family transport system permease protein